MARKKSKSTSSRTEKELRTLGQRLDALIGQARRTEREAQTRYARQIQALRARQAQAKKAVQRLRRRSIAAAPPLKAGLQRAWADLNDAVKQATARFRRTS